MARVALIMNQGAGAAGTAREQQLRSAIAAAPDIELVVAAPGKLLEVARTAAKSCEILAAAGGDGTVSAVASVAIAAGKPFGVVPLGTLNHFAADAGIPADLAAAVQTLAAGRTRRIDYATAGDKVFLNNSSIGLYPTLVRRRQKQERTLGKWPAAALEAWRIIRRPLSSARFAISYSGQIHRLRTAFIFIGNNDYRLNEAGLNNRTRLDEGHLCLFAFRHHSRRALIAAFIRSFFGFRNRRHVLEAAATRVTIRGKQKTVEVACDGEVHRLNMPVIFEIHPQALELVAP